MPLHQANYSQENLKSFVQGDAERHEASASKRMISQVTGTHRHHGGYTSTSHEIELHGEI